MAPTLDDLLGATMALVRGLRAEGRGEEAHGLLAALTGGCSSPELVQCLRAELLGLPEELAVELRDQVRSLLEQVTAWLEAEGY
jgi:hypothetical protein